MHGKLSIHMFDLTRNTIMHNIYYRATTHDAILDETVAIMGIDLSINTIQSLINRTQPLCITGEYR